MNKNLEKWREVLDTFGIKDDNKLQKLADYAEQHMNIKYQSQNYNQEDLPMSLKILSKLEITKNPKLVETHTYNV